MARRVFQWHNVALVAGLIDLCGRLFPSSEVASLHTFCGLPANERCPHVLRRADADDYWSVLGVEPGTSVKEVKRVYRQRAKKEHPDVNKSPDALQRWRRLSDAYGKLIDPLYRKTWEQQAQSRKAESRGPSYKSSRSSYTWESKAPNFQSSGTTRSSRSQGFSEASKWAAAGWDAFRDLLQRAERAGASRSGESVAIRESRAARVELEKIQLKLQQLQQDEARFLDLTERFRRNGQKNEELDAGKRTGMARVILYGYSKISSTCSQLRWYSHQNQTCCSG